MKKNKFQKLGLAIAFCAMSAVSVLAEGSSADSLISTAQGEVTGYISSLGTALGAVLAAGLGLKALPWVARKVGGFFRG